MPAEFELNAAVSGSFTKFKPEIDAAIYELREEGVNVLGPEPGSPVLEQKGGIYLPYREFAPLPSEIGMTEEEVEDKFIEECVLPSDFILVVGGYAGEKVTREMMTANANNISIYARQLIVPNPLYEEQLKDILPKVPILPIPDIVKIEQEAKALKKIGLVRAGTFYSIPYHLDIPQK